MTPEQQALEQSIVHFKNLTKDIRVCKARDAAMIDYFKLGYGFDDITADTALNEVKAFVAERDVAKELTVVETTPTAPSRNGSVDEADIVQPDGNGEFPSPIDGALWMASLGLPQIPLRGKQPFMKEWQNHATTDFAQIRKWAAEYTGCNFGSVAKKGDWFVFEADSPDVRERFEKTGSHFSAKLAIQSRNADRGHRWYKYADGVTNISQSDTKHGDFSVRAENQQCVSAGSIHPETKTQYKVVCAGIPEPPTAQEIAFWNSEKISKDSSPISPAGERRLLKHGQMHGAYVAEAGRLWNRGYEVDDVVEMTVRWTVANSEDTVDEAKVRKEALNVTHIYKRGEAPEAQQLEFNQKQPYSAPAEPVKAEPATAAAPEVQPFALEEKDIPPYNPTIECGFFKEVIDAVCNETTIPRQFMHNVIKTFVGALVSAHLKFDRLDCNSCIYSVNIGPSGTSKRTVWNRGIWDIFGNVIVAQDGNSIKTFDSVDSGAGLRDAFFDAPSDVPILVMIDEAASLGNKANATKNPEIVDTIIEMADSTTISRVKAQKSLKRKAGKTHSNARLALYICAQTGEVVTQAFEGRKKQGIRERLSVEFSPPIEPSLLPTIPDEMKRCLADKLLKLISPSKWQRPMTMTPEASDFLARYWAEQPLEIRQKLRLWKNLLLDTYLRAFSRQECAATLEDAQLCAEHFDRDKVIRKVHFRGEISNRVGLYVERLKFQTEVMRQQLNKGLPVAMVAMTKRDLQTKTHAFDDNELDFFDRAITVFGKAHLWVVYVKAANGQTYTKYIPMAHETEVWDLSAGVAEFKN